MAENRITIKRESLASRCEICHQTDDFDPVTDQCLRCLSAGVLVAPRVNEISTQSPASTPAPIIWDRSLVTKLITYVMMHTVILSTNYFLVWELVFEDDIYLNKLPFYWPLIFITIAAFSISFRVQLNQPARSRTLTLYLTMLGILISYGCFVAFLLAFLLFPRGGDISIVWLIVTVGHIYGAVWWVAIWAINLGIGSHFFDRKQ